MRKSMFRALAIGMGSVALLPITSGAVTPVCDQSWTGTALSAAQTVNGHVVGVLGLDGAVRLNEWLNASQTWSGWTVLPPFAGTNRINESVGNTSVWVQSIANPGTTNAAQNVYTTDPYAPGKNDSINQWVCNSTNLGSNGADWKCVPSEPKISMAYGSQSVVGHVASAQMDNSSAQWGGKQFLFASFTDGTVKYKVWTPNGTTGGVWDVNWTEMGITGVQSSPYAVQLTPTTVDLFVQQSNGSIQHRICTNGTWGLWTQLPNTSGTGAPSPLGGIASVVNSANNQFVYAFSSTGFPQWQSTGNGGSTWSGWTSMVSTFPAKGSLAPVRGTTVNALTIYGIDANNAIWRVTSNIASTVNCSFVP